MDYPLCEQSQKIKLRMSANENSREMSLGLAPLGWDSQGISIRGQTTPSERELRAQRRDNLRSVHESVVKNDNDISNIPLSRGIDTTGIGNKFDVPHTQNVSVDKTPEENNPSTNLHSPMQSNALESLSDDDDVVPSYSGPLNHKTRSTNLTDFEANRTGKINFPKSSDITAWKELDKELDDALPIVFNEDFFNYSNTSMMSKKFDKFLVGFFTERCGLVSDGDAASGSSKKGVTGSKKIFRHRGLERLRRSKNELRKAYRVLCKNNMQNSAAGRRTAKAWRETMRKHNRLRIAVTKLRNAKKATSERRNFKRDWHGYASKLFDDTKNAAPTFTKEEATKYFSETYSDEGRGEAFDPLPGLERPSLPKVIFDDRCPSLKELHRSVRKKPNGAAAGINGLTYVVYKKCPSIMRVFHKIVKKIHKTQDIPEDWAQAFIVLLSKSDVLHKPSEFRPIAITNTVGKIFFSVISDRLQQFMLKNRYIRLLVQKGFLSGIPGCLEHAFTLYEALRDAKEHQKQIVVAWIDLANAYGSVRHNLIQFALNWYHVPELIQKLIFDYYEKLMAKVQTNEWSTGFFLFDIGLFQGCVLSTILFDVVFQLLLDLLKPLEGLGYMIKDIKYTKMSRAYADDLNFSARTPEGLQEACDVADVFLKWSKTMKAKPRKCIAVGFRQFDKRSDSGKYKRHYNLKYTPFDPEISISGHPMRFIYDDSKKEESLLRDHFKFLGRWISIDLNELKVKEFVKERFLDEVKLINKTRLSGFMKLWLYQHYILAHLAWPFLIHDFNLSFATELRDLVGSTLKRWAGVYRSADIGSLFRTRDNFGLGLTSVSHFFCKMQLIKCSLLDNSADPGVRLVFGHKAKKTSAWSVKWSVHRIFKSYSADVLLQTKFPSQSGRLGLGHGVFNGNPSKADVRKLITKTADDIDQQKLFCHSAQLSTQGEWINWSQGMVPFDLSWRNLIFGPGDRIISFVLNATINGCNTPVMMKLWGYKRSDDCSLCEKSPCTLHHILSNCHVSLIQQRYTWRHDSVLLNLKHGLVEYLKVQAKRPRKSLKQIKFIKKGDLSKKASSSMDRTPYVLDKARDWELLVDFTKEKIVFPPEIYSTSERPDILLVSRSSYQGILVELTCPAEEGVEPASLRKKARYNQLLADVNDDPQNPWSISLFTIEGGARGFVAHSMLSFLRKIGMAPRRAKSLCKEISSILARCSYAIFLQKDAPHWDANRKLIDLSPPGPSPLPQSPEPAPPPQQLPSSCSPYTEMREFEKKCLAEYDGDDDAATRPKTWAELVKRQLDDIAAMDADLLEPESPMDPDLLELERMLDM